jgi:hypothetical protein
MGNYTANQQQDFKALWVRRHPADLRPHGAIHVAFTDVEVTCFSELIWIIR